MPHNDMAGSITYKQEKLIERLLKEGRECESAVFADIAGHHVEIKDLSEAEASELITDLLANDIDEPEATEGENTESRPASRAPRPVSPNQLKFLRDLIDKKGLANDGVIDQEHLLSRLNASTASKLIDAFKYMPQLEASP